MGAGATQAVRVLVSAKVPHTVHQYRHDPGSSSYGLEAAEALGVRPESVFKTLIVELSDGKLAVAIAPVNCTLSLKAAASALGASRATMADPAKAQRSTGYVLGGISPLGQKKQLATVIDSSVLTHEQIFCSAGKRGMEIELASADLIQLTSAVVAHIAARTS
ncbi:Cys-tRNA(Pro) deacylase [Antrihabitans cavernicola]|uniref:Cys-tRNA(Pro)/Cys-tRNA(Cys) deacylase n=1 Tax=Antrihabitans cavernicola TaxID=2495913 RepID=A0A5A7SCW5_9NOCA|nr:Cys-tRNA(Pro) deacylase [Spelaeibacter cavernicola]KAA0023998.1 Cys-tRNA(Pro) deacylase [Spelaeibacter cavernicola]